MAELDPVIHTEPRLRIMAALVSVELGTAVTFTVIQDALGLTSGNLSVQLRRLEDAGYVTVEKGYRARRPVTYVEASARGREAFAAYTAALRDVLTAAPDLSLAETRHS